MDQLLVTEGKGNLKIQIIDYSEAIIVAVISTNIAELYFIVV